MNAENEAGEQGQRDEQSEHEQKIGAALRVQGLAVDAAWVESAGGIAKVDRVAS